MKIFGMISIMLLILPLTGNAQDANGNYAIWGAGNKSCISYSNARKEDNYDSFKYYIMGYLTAYNALTPETFRLSGKKNLNEILVWFDDYCELKAINAFDLALTDFVVEHYEKRLKSASSRRGR